ncbi:hypothetical protein AVEN_60124-1 [Araneus ventricosus]|uniref:Secreted protein n=1 Tax=Araneus ventricosus TaxID=182803 RepID=A0A4Y2GK88_ARAVE|nr:hypothetical protein AVEN_60124-1 [Araneus ventricosus]
MGPPRTAARYFQAVLLPGQCLAASGCAPRGADRSNTCGARSTRTAHTYAAVLRITTHPRTASAVLRAAHVPRVRTRITLPHAAWTHVLTRGHLQYRRFLRYAWDNVIPAAWTPQYHAWTRSTAHGQRTGPRT